MLNLKEIFERNAGENGKFDRVPNKLHSRPDLCAFLLLSSLADNAEEDGDDIISWTSSACVVLSVSPDILRETTTEDDIITLIRCGVSYDADEECFLMLK